MVPLGIRQAVTRVTNSRPTREPFVGEPTGIVGGKQKGYTRDVVRLSYATEWCACEHRLLEIATDDAGIVRALWSRHPASRAAPFAP
jgi:hypothetical protein